MIEKLTLLILFYSTIFSPFAYTQSGCNSGTSIAVLDANNVKASLPMGALWTDNNDAGYAFPNNTINLTGEVHSIFAGGLWFGGIDPIGNLKLSAITYEAFNGQSAYTPGPLDPNTGSTTAQVCADWDKHFQTTQTDVNSFLQDWSDGSLDNPIPNSILGWPARGNPFFFGIHNFELPNTPQGLAPFWDENADGLYNPENGDYPFIKEATQAVWWVLNNANSSEVFSAASPNLEIQMMAYAYASDIESLNNSTFYDVKYINRGMESIDSMFVSLWIDADLGCYSDDYMGCTPDENMAFIYNSDDIDGETGCFCPGGVVTYCEEIPITGIKLIKGPIAERLKGENGDITVPPIGVSGDTLVELGLSSFNYYSSFGPQGSISATPPNLPFEYYSYMNGRFRDGSPIIDDNGEVTNFAYSGNPANGEEWSMCSENASASLDRRILLNVGPMNFPPGAVNELTYCVSSIENFLHPCPDISVLTDAMNEVQDLWEDNNIPLSTKPIVNSAELRVFPNPMKTTTQIALDDENDLIETIEIFNVNGQSVLVKSGLNDQNATISRGQLNAGVYFYTILTKNQKIFSGKLMVK